MMKKILALLLALVMVVGLVACGNSGSNQPSGSQTPAGSNQPSGSQAPSGSTAIEGKYTIRLGTPTGGKHQQNATMDMMKANNWIKDDEAEEEDCA